MQILRQALRNIRDDAPLYLVLVVYTTAGLAFLVLTGHGELATYSTYIFKWAVVFLFILPSVTMLIHIGRLLHRFDKRRSLAAKRIFATRHAAHFLSGLCFVLALVMFQGTFTSVKNGLSAWFGGFPHDRMLADLDAALHFGIDPWRLLYAAADPSLLIGAIQLNYSTLWFLICFGALFYVATSPRAARIRNRYLLCFMLVWLVIGNLAAGALLSAGPAYYGFVTGDHGRFAEQLTLLAGYSDQPGSAAYYQNYLWMLHEKGLTGFGSGISAFPSVHVGLITMNALFAAERSRTLGLLAFAYVALILMSSVYLAWHYALDGYAAIAITVAMHYALRRWMKLRENRSGVEQPTPAGAPMPA